MIEFLLMRTGTRIYLTLLLILIPFLEGFSQRPYASAGSANEVGNLPALVVWVDSVYNSLTPVERVAQLLMIRANSTGDSAEIRQISDWIRKYNLGGLCFFKGGPVRQAILTNYYQSMAKTPLLISMDAEWGAGMRLDSTMSFARQMTLGAMDDDSLIVAYGLEIARQLKRLGVHISFSPVADINSNPDNPVINVRSFGEDKRDVARKAVLYMKGLQQGGMLSVAKHFPGHGDTDTDSHFSLPFIDHSLETIDTLDLYPFRELIRAGVDGMMIAHLFIPALDTATERPSSISPLVISELLRKKLDFSGVVFSDALDMKGAARYAPPGDLELKALEAGNDILLLPESVDSAIARILRAADSGLIQPAIIEEHCKRVLAMKYRAGLNKPQQILTKGLPEDMNTSQAEFLNRSLYEHALTLLKNENGILPVAMPDTLKIASVSIGYSSETLFQQRLSDYVTIDHYTLPREPEKGQAEELFHKLTGYNLLLVAVNNTHPSPARKFGMSDAGIRLVDSLLQFKPSILTLFALPYSVELFKHADAARAIVVAYQDNPFSYDMAAQLIFGGITARGHSPVTISSRYPVHSGVADAPPVRLKFSMPEEVGIPSKALMKIDTIAMEGISQKAYPGCQIMVSRNGKVIYSKTFGYQDYSKKQPVTNSDIYDLASVTKVAATTLAVMKLHDEGLIEPKKPLSKYIPELHGTNKSRITVQEVMAHQSGLPAWIPFYKGTLINGQPDTLIYRKAPDQEHQTRVAEGLYIRNGYTGRIVDSICQLPLSPKKEYRYSDLGFILMQQAVEHISGAPLNQYLDRMFYRPMGLPTMGFLPRERFPLSRIVPTENDTVFRHQLIHGDVHDPAAAMMGGVAGHAGLFGNATDLAVLFQMLLQNGNYGGRHYLDSATVAEFTSRQFQGNRRGLGFDKPQDPGEEGPACSSASPKSFGHTGFTGTYVWADPEEELIIVFLSNRVHPDAGLNKLVQLGTRTRIQQVVYDAIRESGNN